MSSSAPEGPKQNRILAALPAEEFSRLEHDLEPVKLSAGQTILKPCDKLSYVYFPTTCIFSLIANTDNGSSAELAMIGKDGLSGIPLVLGGGTSIYKVVVQSAGHAYRLPSEVMRWELDQGGALRSLSLCFAQALMTQMAQSVVCNRHHAVEQQLCRWLLLSLDRLAGNQIDVTQEMIANMLGVRREAITEDAGKLHAAGLIEYRRGHITVTDRPGLEARVCECYHVVKAEYERLFHLSAPIPLQHRPRHNPATLRQRAEERLTQSQPAPRGSQWDVERLLHELQVHQIELEMRNEELLRAYEEADTLREKYADIYDFAPVGYFTLDAHGSILQVNLAGAILLGIKRSQMGRTRFCAAVKPECLPEFDAFLDAVLKGHAHDKCEITLMATSQRPEARVRIEAVVDENGRECRMVVMDITDTANGRVRPIRHLPFPRENHASPA
jgi:CRP-like cAMP-binding protein